MAATKVGALKTLCTFTILILSTSATYAQSISIDWEVTNRFRSFDYLANNPTERAKIFQKFSIDRKTESVAQWQHRLASSNVLSPFARSSGPWNEKDAGNPSKGGSYDKNFLELPDSIQVRLTSSITADDVRKRCTWTVDGQVIKPPGGNQPDAARACADGLVINVRKTGSNIKVQADNGTEGFVRVEPKLKIIVGLGDSYASGQGNPDRPTKWKNNDIRDPFPELDRKQVDSLVAEPPRWFSNECNRAFNSYQNYVALAIATANPKSIVSFVHLACSGAEVVDGMFSPQFMSPGYHPSCADKKRPKDDLLVECDVARSQLRALVDMICTSPVINLTEGESKKYTDELQELAHNRDSWKRVKDLGRCPQGKGKPIDSILLSIGGNDMGFGRVILWGLMPQNARTFFLIRNHVGDAVMHKAGRVLGVVCPIESDDKRCDRVTAMTRIGQLHIRYKQLAVAFDALLGQAKKPLIYINQYPNPLFKKRNELCGNPAQVLASNEWDGNRIEIPIKYLRTESMINLTTDEARQVNKHVIPSLNKEILKAGNTHRWNVVNQDDVMVDNGWCTGPNAKLPRPSDAANWNPYVINSRMIRTGNDSFLTQWPGETARYGLSGTFHPTARAHAAFADRVLDAMNTPDQ